MHEYVGQVHICAQVNGGQRSILGVIVPREPSTLYFETGSPIVLELPIWTVWLASKPQGSSASPVLGLLGCTTLFCPF